MKHLNPFENNINWKSELYSLLEKKIELGDSLNKKLNSMDDDLSTKMLDFFNSDNIKDDANVSKVDYDSDDNKLLTLYDEKGKPRKFKFGKLLSYLGYDTNNIKPYEVENFMLQFKKVEASKERMKEVKGQDILASYNCKNYLDISTSYDRGGLGVSCMRFERTQDFLEIYTTNPNQVSCLTLYTEEGDKVQGRALIWTLDSGDKFMDRIYAYEKDDYVFFYNYAEKNNISRDKGQMFVELDRGGEYDYYPYMDTFEYYLPERNLLTNYDPTENGEEDYEDEPIYQLLNTNGTADSIGEGGEMVESDYMGERIRKDEAVRSDYMDDWIYEHDSVQLFRGLDKSPDWIIKRHENVIELSYMSDDYEAGEGNMPDEPYALKDDCVMIKQKEGYNLQEWVLKADTKAYVEIDSEYYINSEEVYIPRHAKKDTFKYASKDSWDEWHPHNLLVSIWSDEGKEMMLVSIEDDKYNKLKSEYSEYVSIDNSCNGTEKCYVPTEFFTEDNLEIPYIKSDAPLVYAVQNGTGRLVSKKVLNERGNITEIQDGHFAHENYVNAYTVETNDTLKVFPPLTISYYHHMTFEEKDIPMISSFENKYENYDDYLARMKELYVFFKKFKSENDEESDKYYDGKIKHMEWALKDYYYFEKALDKGTILEKNLIDKNFQRKTDSIFKTTDSDLEEIFSLLSEFINNNKDVFTAESISGEVERYRETEQRFKIVEQSSYYISFMGMYYDTPTHKVFPYFYADKTDKYVVCKNDSDSFGEYTFMTLEEIKTL
jgi:hypothetical protein